MVERTNVRPRKRSKRKRKKGTRFKGFISIPDGVIDQRAGPDDLAGPGSSGGAVRWATHLRACCNHPHGDPCLCRRGILGPVCCRSDDGHGRYRGGRCYVDDECSCCRDCCPDTDGGLGPCCYDGAADGGGCSVSEMKMKNVPAGRRRGDGGCCHGCCCCCGSRHDAYIRRRPDPCCGLEKIKRIYYFKLFYLINYQDHSLNIH